MQRLDVGDVERVLVVLPLRPAIGEARAYAGLVERSEVALGIFAAADVVAPVVHRGHAGIDRLGRRQARALIHVVVLAFLSKIQVMVRPGLCSSNEY